jgi:hypothetical protein
MDLHGIVIRVTLCAGLAPASLASQSPPHAPAEALRQAAFGRALREIGRSGLRGLLSATGNLGDLQNRAGSYRMAAQLEHARTAALEGRISALDNALADPTLPPERRQAILDLRDAARAELSAVPRYEAAYRTATTQVEALKPLCFVGDRPVFLLVRARGHARWGGDDGLTVVSAAVSVGPVVVASNRWIVSPGLSLGRTDVEIGAFDGASATTSLGPRLDVGHIFGDRWSFAVHLSHVWAHGGSTIVRPGPEEGTEVRTEGWSRINAVKVESTGRLPIEGPSDLAMSIRPLVGAYMTSTSSPATTNSLGESGTGPFGSTERTAALRAGATFEAILGAWSPALFAGWEWELTDQMSALIDDPRALIASVGLTRSWGQGRRVAIEYALLRGQHSLRRVSDLTLVLILDG